MAGIEKICEYSGEYPAWRMYGYKRDHIQIMPQYRKEFRGKDHQLIIFKPELYWEYRRHNGVSPYDPDEWQYPYNPPFSSEREFIQWHSNRYSCRLVNQYYYILKVPQLPGRVNGEYMNYTTNLGNVYRRLKRLLRCEKLHIERKNITHRDYIALSFSETVGHRIKPR